MSSAIHGNGNQNIRIEGLDCTGREPHIAACKFHGWGHIRCSADKAVGVICGNIYKNNRKFVNRLYDNINYQ